MPGIREFLMREPPKIRTEYILKTNIDVAEKNIPRLKSLLKRLKAGERPKAVQIGSTTRFFPQVKYVERDLKRYQEGLPKLRKWLKLARKKKKLKRVM